MVNEIIRYILLGLAVLFLLGAIIFLLRALRLRSSSRSEAYNVLRLNQRRSMVNQAFASVGALLLSLILFAIGGLMPFGNGAAEEQGQPVVIPSLTPESAAAAPVQPTEATDSQPEVASPSPPAAATEVFQTSEPPAPTAEPTVTTVPTPTRVPAVVNSPVVGLYLRSTPGGEIIERLEDQIQVELLGEEQISDGLIWVLVAAPSENQGWVARDFLLVGQTLEDLPTPTETPPADESGDQGEGS